MLFDCFSFKPFLYILFIYSIGSLAFIKATILEFLIVITNLYHHIFISYTSIIHTDVFDRGLLVPLGDVDYYVNGGFNQPGCYEQIELSPGSCNHDRAPEYYAESINSEEGFWGFRCGKF